MPKLVMIYEIATGMAYERFSVDAEEAVASGFYSRTPVEVAVCEEPVSEATDATGAGVAFAAPEVAPSPDPEPELPPVPEEKPLTAWSLLMAASKRDEGDTRPALIMADLSKIQARMKELYIGNDDVPDLETIMEGLPYAMPSGFANAVPEIVSKLRDAAK